MNLRWIQALHQSNKMEVSVCEENILHEITGYTTANLLVIYFGEFSTGWEFLAAYQAPFTAMFANPTSIASLSYFSLLLFSDRDSSVASSLISATEGSRSRGPALIHR